MPPAGRTFFTYVSLILLLVAIGVLVWGLYSAMNYTLTHTGPPCSNPPQRSATPPQWEVVLVCLAAFVAGHLTAQWQAIDPAHTLRHKRDKTNESEHPRPEQDPRKNEALLIQGLLLVFLIEVFGLLTIEMLTLANNVWPITYYVRCAYNAAGTQSMLAAAAILFLVGRWFWLPARKA